MAKTALPKDLNQNHGVPISHMNQTLGVLNDYMLPVNTCYIDFNVWFTIFQFE